MAGNDTPDTPCRGEVRGDVRSQLRAAGAVLHVLVDAPVATVMADRRLLFRPARVHRRAL